MVTRRRSTSVKSCANVSTVRATRSRPAPRSSIEILRRGKGDQQASVVAQDTPEFARIHPRRDRQDDRERAVGVRHEAIGIGHDPLAFGVAPRRGIHGRNRDVDAMRIEAGLASEAAEVETVAAAGIENDVARATRPSSPRSRRSSGSVTPRSCNRRRAATAAARVARLLGSPILRLEQVDVSAARDVERMSARTNHSPLLARQRQVAAADGAEEHDSIVRWLLVMPIKSNSAACLDCVLLAATAADARSHKKDTAERHHFFLLSALALLRSRLLRPAHREQGSLASAVPDATSASSCMDSGPRWKAAAAPRIADPASPVSQDIVRATLSYMPTESLIQHEWATHGTCTGLNARITSRLSAGRAIWSRFPMSLRAPARELRMNPEEIEARLAAANPNFPRGSVSRVVLSRRGTAGGAHRAQQGSFAASVRQRRRQLPDHRTD